MKKLTLIAITLFALLSCQAQEPKQLDYFTIEQMDSVKNSYEFKLSSKDSIINYQGFQNDSLNNIVKNYTGKTIFINDTAKTIVFGSYKHQLGFTYNEFELFFGDKDYIYRLTNNTDFINIEKRYRNDSLSIKLSVPLND